MIVISILGLAALTGGGYMLMEMSLWSIYVNETFNTMISVHL